MAAKWNITPANSRGNGHLISVPFPQICQMEINVAALFCWAGSQLQPSGQSLHLAPSWKQGRVTSLHLPSLLLLTPPHPTPPPTTPIFEGYSKMTKARVTKACTNTWNTSIPPWIWSSKLYLLTLNCFEEQFLFFYFFIFFLNFFYGFTKKLFMIFFLT